MFKDKKNQIILITIIAILNCFLYLVILNYPLISDSLAFDDIAKNIMNGHGYSITNQITGIKNITMIREPLYSYLLSLVYKFSNINYTFTYILQGILLCITAIAGYFIALEIFKNNNLAFLSGILIAINPSLGNYTNQIMSEMLFTSLITVSLYSLIIADKKQQKYLFLLSGIFLGLSILTRSYSALFFIFLIPILIFSSYKRSLNIKNTLKLIIIMILATTITCLPWIIRNKIQFNTLAITYRAGLMLNTRTKELSMKDYEKNPYIISAFSEKIAKQLYPKCDVKNLAKKFDKQSTEELKASIKTGISPQIADKLLLNNAIKEISYNLPEYFLFSLVNVVKLNKTYHLPSLSRKENTLSDPLKLIIKSTLKIFYLLTILLAILAIILDRKNYVQWLIPASFIIFTNLVFSFIYCIPRYAVPLYPLYTIFASLGIYLMYSKWHNKDINLYEIK